MVSEKLHLSTKAEVADRLHSAAIHLLRLLRLQDDSCGVGPAKLSALSILVFVGPKTLGELAQMEQVKPPTMSRIIAGLEDEGLVVRKTDKDDQRSSWLHPTAKGKKLLFDARSRRVEELTARLNLVDGEELRCLQQAANLIEQICRHKPALDGE